MVPHALRPVRPDEIPIQRDSRRLEAFRDRLTGLPNRSMFMDRVGWMLRDAKHAGKNRTSVAH